jgi:hypothetical protein
MVAPTKLQVLPAYTQYVGQKNGRVVDGINVPYWVDDDYLDSWVMSAKRGNPRAPNAREFTEAIAGVPLEQLVETQQLDKYGSFAPELLYGVVGANKDTRDWSAIMSSSDIVDATRKATALMYSGTEATKSVIEDGKYPTITNPSGKAAIVSYTDPTTNATMYSITSASGLPLRVFSSLDEAKKQAVSFGITDVVSGGKYNEPKPKTSFTPVTTSQPTTSETTPTTPISQPTPTTPDTTTTSEKSKLPSLSFPTIFTAAPYGLPSSYAGSGYSPIYSGVMQAPQGVSGAQNKIPSSVSTYGTLPFTYTPTTTYTIGAGGMAAPATIAAPQQMEVKIYRNVSGLTTSITFIDGKPTTPIPSGFFPADQAPPVPQAPSAAIPQVPVPQIPQTPTMYNPQFNMAVGGLMPSTKNIVSGFKPNAMQRIASSLGYTGDIANFNNFLAENPAANQKYNMYMQAAQQMANGGYVRKYQEGGDVQKDPRVLSQQYIPQQNFPAGATLPQVQATIAKTPGLPTGATVVPTGTAVELGQLVSPTSGQVSGGVALPTAQAATTAAAMPQVTPSAKVSTVESTEAVSATVNALQAAQGTLDPRAQVLAAQQTASSVGNVQAAQGNAILMTNPVQRQIQDGELIAPAANAEIAAKFTEQIEAAEATPTKQATVQGQLEQLMTQFEGGKTPAWAAASMRNAMATLSARGLGASSLAGQAVIQAAMEAALPIAQLDAQTQASFEAQNLSNRQQRAVLAAQQRAAFLGQEFDQTFQSRVANAAKISDVANMNFTAEQQVALENSRIANTMELQNLSNRQAVVLAEAAALANMDMANLNNRQQAAVMNAQNFLAVDMQNLSNQQQTDLFRAQSRIQALFTDQAAQNASQQFNASSENQVNQFFSSLAAQVGQFNATQANAQSQFNAGQINTIERFNAEINNQRDQFNAQNRLIIDQSNAQWRREISTAATAAVNRANEINAASLVGLSQSAYNNLWQYYRDNMEWAWTSAENERQRVVNLAMAQLQADASKDIQKMKEDYESSAAFGGLIGKFITGGLTGGFSNLFS